MADKRISELQVLGAKDATELAALRLKIEELTGLLSTSREDYTTLTKKYDGLVTSSTATIAGKDKEIVVLKTQCAKVKSFFLP